MNTELLIMAVALAFVFIVSAYMLGYVDGKRARQPKRDYRGRFIKG